MTNKITKHIPNFFTASNLFAGLLGILMVLFFRNPKIACYIMFVAVGFDLLDGLTARLFKAQSSIGKELDSLSDVVSFGVLPGVLMFHLMYNVNPALMINLFEMGGRSSKYLMIFPLIAFIFPVAAAFRLAKFNVEEQKLSTFSGLSSPAAALFIAAIILNPHTNGILHSLNLTLSLSILSMVTIILSFLMNSSIAFLSLKIKTFSIKNNYITYIFALVSLLLIILIGLDRALIIILFIYIIVSSIFAKKNI